MGVVETHPLISLAVYALVCSIVGAWTWAYTFSDKRWQRLNQCDRVRGMARARDRRRA